MAASQQSSSSFSRAQLLGYISLCLIWGSTWLAIRVVVHDVPPLEAAALRFVAAGALLLGLALLQRRRWPHRASQWNALAALSLSIMALPYRPPFLGGDAVTSALCGGLCSSSSPVV